MSNYKDLELKIIYLKSEDITPYINNTRTHSKEQIQQIKSSIAEFGMCSPIGIHNGVIVYGHARFQALQELKYTSFPCLDLSHLTDTQRKAYVIADNQLPLNAGWDEDMLRLELDSLKELDFDIGLLGFEDDFMSEIGCDFSDDEQGDKGDNDGLTDADEIQEPSDDPISVLGDVWQLGDHRVMCGDSTSIDDVDKLIDGHKVDMVFTDPPYGISIVQNNQIGGGGAFGVGKEAKKTGKVLAATQYAPVAGDESINVAVEAIRVIKTLGAKVEIIWGGNYYAQHLDNSNCWIVWDKQTGENTFADAELAWTNQDTKVRIFEHRWMGLYKASEHGEKRVHPTQKPIALAEWCLNIYGEKCETVLDLFGGSGFTLIACETKNKDAFIMELSEAYVDVIINRWQNFTGKEAIHIESGKTHTQLKQTA